MALDLNTINGYGTGALGDVTNPTGQINSYANITAITSSPNTITIDSSPSLGIYETFAVGKEIMIHVLSTNGTSYDTTYLGNYILCKITAVNGSVLTIDKDPTTVVPTGSFANYFLQAVTVANFNNLILSSGSISVLSASMGTKRGGVIIIKCANTLTMSGGSISLTNGGISPANSGYRPSTYQETNGKYDTDKYSGWENHITIRNFLVNGGDGAAFIVAKHFVQTGTASRIGGTAAGVQFTRDTAGGSTIALIAGDMTGFSPMLISKVKNSGLGIGRCYIASSTKLRNDEGLYAYDVISDPSRLKNIGIKDFGNGSFGSVTNPTTPLNNYASITAISSDGKTITYSNKTTNGQYAINTGSYVMFHVSKHTDSSDMSQLGKFMIAKVLSDDGINSLVLDTSVSNVFYVPKLSKYNCQIISIPQMVNFTLSTEYTATTAYNNTINNGGIFAIACSGTCDITNGKVNVVGKGGTGGYGSNGLSFIGNAQNCDALPLGASSGSVLIIANVLKGNASSRIGGTQDGSTLGGAGLSTDNGGGYKGADRGSNAGGSGAGGGISGEYGSTANGDYGCTVNGGSHIFIAANTIDGLSIKNISTGGNLYNHKFAGSGYGSGGDAYTSNGAGGGYNGGGASAVNSPGGSSSGWCFVYCNNYINGSDVGVVV